ncbi:hypothetical protein R1sor_006654 [Riccia sorocarpa]|uniref:Uncharacterized protein n=1 Tax=Riccia sorocarpa TaxID=122646 RepID=A0ABD3HN26_9MARC
MARPKMMATMKKRARVEKPKDDTDENESEKSNVTSTSNKKSKKEDSVQRADIDETEANVEEMLDKILKKRAEINSVSRELIFTDKELDAIGANNLAYLSYCYPLGLSMIMQVSVSKILPPTPLYGCRPFSENHMWDSLLSLSTKKAVIPQVADLLPVRITKTANVGQKEGASETKLRLETQEELRRAVADPEVFFYAVSGQHSAYAQNYLQRLSNVSESIKENNKMRWSRILDGKAKIVDFCKISHVGNEQNVLSRFESSFIELMVQARNQWIHSGSP